MSAELLTLINKFECACVLTAKELGTLIKAAKAHDLAGVGEQLINAVADASYARGKCLTQALIRNPGLTYTQAKRLNVSTAQLEANPSYPLWTAFDQDKIEADRATLAADDFLAGFFNSK